MDRNETAQPMNQMSIEVEILKAFVSRFDVWTVLPVRTKRRIPRGSGYPHVVTYHGSSLRTGLFPSAADPSFAAHASASALIHPAIV